MNRRQPTVRQSLTILLLMLAAACFAAYVARGADLRRNVAVCYGTDGETVVTTYTGGDGGIYPVHSVGEIEQTEAGFVVRHRTVFHERGTVVWLPVVRR